MLEWYRAGGDYYDLMRDCEELLLHVTRQCLDTSAISYRGDRIAFHEGMHILKVTDVFLDYCGISVTEAVADSTFDELMGLRIEPALPRDKPVILTDYPAQMAALSRLKQSDPAVAERFELYVGGLELANGFSELVDPDEQRRRFYEANRSREAAGMSGLPLPDRFLDELALMPESAGIALGVDRLVMLCAGEDAIDAVVPFTPEQL